MANMTIHDDQNQRYEAIKGQMQKLMKALDNVKAGNSSASSMLQPQSHPQLLQHQSNSADMDYQTSGNHSDADPAIAYSHLAGIDPASCKNFSKHIDLKNHFIIDSGATDHFVCDSKAFTHSAAPLTARVQLPNHTFADITHKGDIKLSDKLTLKDVLCVPSFEVNLLSTSKITAERKISFLLIHDLCIMQEISSQKVIGTARKHKSLLLLYKKSLYYQPFLFNQGQALATKHVSFQEGHVPRARSATST